MPSVTSEVTARREVEVPGESKVSDLDTAMITDKDVTSCQIAVYEATLLQVQHAFSHLANRYSTAQHTPV